MKALKHTTYSLTVAALMLFLFTSLAACEQQDYEPNANAAPGGGTITTYKAYTLTAVGSPSVYGRVVFYRYSPTVTLVQMGLYNTTSSTAYAAAIYGGTATAITTTPLKPLDKVNGSTGAFATSKYVTVSESGFYDKLSTYNANVRILAGTTAVASGNIGANAAPVEQSQ